MNELDEVIRKYRSDFEEEPIDGHFLRFENRLNAAKATRRLPKYFSFFKVAAVLTVLLLSANLYVYFRKVGASTTETVVSNSDLDEAAYYYAAKINRGIGDLEVMAKEGIGTQNELAQIKSELSEMDSLFVKLRMEFNENPSDERIINAMIEHYQTKLDIVTTIKEDLENVKNLKEKYHEGTEI